MPVILDSWVEVMKEGVQNAAASLQSLAIPQASDSAMPSLKTLSKIAIGGAQVLLGGGQGVAGGFTQSCPSPQLSCHNTTAVEDLCCFNAPGGQLLQTQFWDTNPPTGPGDSWTLHGLWPDRCDGSYDANCDPQRAYRNISEILTTFGETDTLNYMSKYWKDYKGDDNSFWSHEWAKHGTCISTLKPSCYNDYKATEEAVDYFKKAVELFQGLPSYKWLSEADITPSTSQTYTFSQIQAALAKNRPGVEVTLRCKEGALNEIWYHHDVRGSLQTGTFVPSNPDGIKSTCPQSGIKYLPKADNKCIGARSGDRCSSFKKPKPKPKPRTTTSQAPARSPQPISSPDAPFSGRGYLNVFVNGAKKGCITSRGAWYTIGPCAKFTATPINENRSFKLSIPQGKCGIVNGALSCGSRVQYSQAFNNNNGDLVAGNRKWSADSVPTYKQMTIYAGVYHEQVVTIKWQRA